MKTFRVGGSVRDALLGLPVQDIDYVVVGSTPTQMIDAGFTPVGKDFPVFLHPQTHAEYALARTERKSAPGYHGFVFHCAPDVTIEQDLARRDLTINAMAIAEDAAHQIIDPFGGQRDLAAKVFRHVSAAFVEDPVRILRVARFAARLPTFTVAPETKQLMRAMVQSGEVDALVPERVWQEIARGLMERQPSRLLEVLDESNALTQILPGIDANPLIKQSVDAAAQWGFSLAVRWAVLFTGIDPTQLCARLKVPTEVRDIALLTAREHVTVQDALSLTPQVLVQLLERCDAFRRPLRLTQLVEAVRCLHYESPFPQQVYLVRAFAAAQGVPSGAIAEATQRRFPHQPQQISKAISAARAEAVKVLTS